MGAADHLLDLLTSHRARIADRLERIRNSGDVKAVHGFRVGTRRLNEPLELVAAWLGPRKVKPIQKRAKRLRQALRAVRDYDVLTLSFHNQRTAPDMDAQHLARLTDRLEKRRKKSVTRAIRKLDKLEPGALLDAVDALIDQIASVVPGEGDRLTDQATDMWHGRIDALLKRDPLATDDVDLHDVRISLKTLRYCTELLTRLDGRDRAALLQAFVQMQDGLGAWNDNVFAIRELARIARQRRHVEHEPEFVHAVLRYAAKRALLKAEDRRRALDAWPALHETIESAASIEPPDTPPQGRAGVTPAESRGNTGASPAESRGNTGASPAESRGNTGVSPAESKGSAGVSPAESKGSAGVSPASSNATKATDH